jgi:agmatine/peptidylarginine deiminase
MIADQDTNAIYFSELLLTDSRFKKTANEIVRILESYDATYDFLTGTKDIWARDYMPIQVSGDKYVEYRYDPDYLQGYSKGYRDLKTYPDFVCDTIGLKTIKSDLILDGGNVVKAANCIILTDKIVIENRFAYSKTKLLKLLHEIFEVEKVVLIPWDKSEEYGHADGMVRFIDEDTVLINHCYKEDSVMLYRLKQAGIKTEFLHYNVKNNDDRNWAYLNFLQTKDLILLPKFGIEEDNQAFEQLIRYFPIYEGRIEQVDMKAVVKYGGALNCISWTITQ